MSGTSVAAEREASMNGANRLKERAALASIAVSALMTAAKFAAGLASGSLAVLSEAGHNLADVAATALTYFAIRIANKPADEEHQFGHAKVEALAALVETGFLFALAVYILIEAITAACRPRHNNRGQSFRFRGFDRLDHRGFGALAVAEADRRDDEERRARRRRAAFFERYRQLRPGALRYRRRALRLSARRRPGGLGACTFHRGGGLSDRPAHRQYAR